MKAMKELQEEIEALQKQTTINWWIKKINNDLSYWKLLAYTKVLSLITKHLSKKQK